MKRLAIVFVYGLTAIVGFAQTEKKLTYEYPQKVVPTDIDNYQFSTYYYNGKKTYNMRGASMSNSGAITQFRVNPAGSSFAVIEQKGNEGSVLIFDLWKSNKLLHKIYYKDRCPTAVCYSPDSRLLAVAFNDNTVSLYDTRDYQAQQWLNTTGTVSKMRISYNNFFLAMVIGSKVSIWNLQDNMMRTEIITDADVNDVDFTRDYKNVAILTANGRLTTYDTQMFQVQQTYDALGEARNCYFHEDGKYLAVVTGDKRIAIINIYNHRERDYIDDVKGGISNLRFLKDGKSESYLAYNTSSAIVYAYMNSLSPYYTRLLADELNNRMEEWLKQRPDETLAQYKKRVNDETRAEQMKLFEREIATRMADRLVERSKVTLGGYDEKGELLVLNFDTMPSIYLKVPQKELQDFADPGILEFRNVVYGINNEDQFELIYADIYNPASGKIYKFNNLNRQSLAYLENDRNFVPLSIIELSNSEELKLQEIKNSMISLAKKHNSITDKTKISVKAGVETEIDASGKRVLNYHIKFSYEVDKRFSAREDFGSGKYKTEESGAALAMLSIMKEAFKLDFAKYIVDGKRLRIKITGMADASPISSAIAYDGCYGDFTSEPVYKDGNLGNVSVSKADGITTNEQLAFLRAVGVRNYIDTNISDFNVMNTEYNYQIDIAKKSGAQFRRINVDCVFVDAFNAK